MNRKKLLLLPIILICIGLPDAWSQNLVIRQNSGTEITELLVSIRNLTFGNGNLMVNFSAGNTDAYNLGDISKLYFNTVTTIEQHEIAANKVILYPNPAKDRLTISNIPSDSQLIQVFSTDGRMVQGLVVSATSETIDISGLRPGLYLVKSESWTSKFIRQ